MTATPDKSHPEPSLEGEVIQGVLFGEFSTHNEKWEQLGSEDAVFARGAIQKAKLLREQHADPGNAYLEAVADVLTVKRMLPSAQKVLAQLASFDPATELDAS